MSTEGGTGRVESSRDSVAGAGWSCEEPGTYLGLTPRYRPAFSWISPSTLWRSCNDAVAKCVDDPVHELRRAWLERLKEPHGKSDLVVSRHASLESYKLVFFGDPGEGDASQYALVPLLAAHERDAESAFISSDVIYPAGGVNEYLEKFYRPYKDFPAPISPSPATTTGTTVSTASQSTSAAQTPTASRRVQGQNAGCAARPGTSSGAARSRWTRPC